MCDASSCSVVILPDEILQLIFEFVPIPDLVVNISLVSQLWYDLVANAEFWRKQCDTLLHPTNVNAYLQVLRKIPELLYADEVSLLKILSLDILRTQIPKFMTTNDERDGHIRRFINNVPNKITEYQYTEEDRGFLFGFDSNIISDVPLPTSFAKIPLAYAEMTMIEGEFATIGLAHKAYPSNKQPGWQPGSCGFHGDDGGIFVGPTGSSTFKSEKYTKGDTVGVGIYARSKEIFFTKNGSLQMIACKLPNDEEDLHICVGMWNSVHVKMNFGQEPFQFDLSVMMDKNMMTEDLNEIRSHKSQNMAMDRTDFILWRLQQIQDRIAEYQQTPISDEELEDMLAFVRRAANDE
jgi:hypothetical protein